MQLSGSLLQSVLHMNLSQVSHPIGGVLANPFQDDLSFHEGASFASNSPSQSSLNSNGDLIPPRQYISFGLDVPFRQGKYASREAIALEELLRVRVGLAPLSTRDGKSDFQLKLFLSPSVPFSHPYYHHRYRVYESH